MDIGYGLLTLRFLFLFNLNLYQYVHCAVTDIATSDYTLAIIWFSIILSFYIIQLPLAHWMVSELRRTAPRKHNNFRIWNFDWKIVCFIYCQYFRNKDRMDPYRYGCILYTYAGYANQAVSMSAGKFKLDCQLTIYIFIIFVGWKLTSLSTRITHTLYGGIENTDSCTQSAITHNQWAFK